ncbi:hypothetical protein DPEC_G00038690 [Dallia pectoralis]|uniref:Uncharacterized protein n=1 Tax=Dallia pectoralis TaxID=75939 RepID=A0ACC2HEL8_DALPE|nr:hypothetical protein DPEC_G00038690 [Dallia pectoralis]
MKMNWRGANGKQAFEPLALKYIVLNAVRRDPLTSNASDTDIEKYIKRWMQLASDRDGGRKNRESRSREDESGGITRE